MSARGARILAARRSKAGHDVEASGPAGFRERLLRRLGRACVGAALVVCLMMQATPARAVLDDFNHWAFEFNRTFEDAVVRPGVDGFRQGTSERVQAWVGRAYRTLTEPVTATAYAIEGDLRAAAASSARFLVNGTVGLAGTFDVADGLGLPQTDKSFSQAVCRSGLPLGAVVILPVVGATTAGIALTAGAIIVGSTYALSLISIELAIASVAIDVIGSAAALENTVKGSGSAAESYDMERGRYVARLNQLCGATT